MEVGGYERIFPFNAASSDAAVNLHRHLQGKVPSTQAAQVYVRAMVGEVRAQEKVLRERLRDLKASKEGVSYGHTEEQPAQEVGPEAVSPSSNNSGHTTANGSGLRAVRLNRSNQMVEA